MQSLRNDKICEEVFNIDSVITVANDLYWNIKGNKHSSFNVKCKTVANNDCLHYYCSMLKGKSFKECGSSLHNIIQTMKLSRHRQVCNEDFTNLDFGNIPFNGIKFSINGNYPCQFANSVINGGLMNSHLPQ